MPKVKIIFDKQNGNVMLEGEGFSGMSCIHELNIITDILDGFTVYVKNKPEVKDTKQRIKRGRK